MYILQQTLFSFEQWLEIESEDRFEHFFSVLDLRPYVEELQAKAQRGRRSKNREAILRALLIAPFENISEFTFPIEKPNGGRSYTIRELQLSVVTQDSKRTLQRMTSM